MHMLIALLLAAGGTQAQTTPTPVKVTNTSINVVCTSGCAGAPGATGLTDAELRATPVPVSVSGVATAAKQDTGNTSLASIDAKIPAAPAATADVQAVRDRLPAALVSGRLDVNVGASATLPVSGTFWQATQPVSGTFWQATQPVSLASLPALSAGTANIGDVDVATLPSVTIGTFPDNEPVAQGTAAAESAPWPVRQQRAATGTLSNVAGSASSVTCLAANSSRLAATVYNDSSADLYIKTGTTASATSFTVKLPQDSYYRPPAGYTGRLDCIWASATGNARVTEFTP